MCTCVVLRVCVPLLRSPKSLSPRASVESGSLAVDRAPPSRSSSLPEAPVGDPTSCLILGEVFGGCGGRSASCQKVPEFSIYFCVSGPLTTQEVQQVLRGTLLLWPPHRACALLSPCTRTRIRGKARVPMGLHGTVHSEQPPGDPT